MEQKQEYTIPENVNGHFEIMQNITLKDLLCFLPTLLLIIPVILMPISLYVKIPIISFMLIISAVLVYVRPVRENIPFWRHVNELLTYYARQRIYHYRKEVYYEELDTEELSKITRSTSTKRTRLHSSTNP